MFVLRTCAGIKSGYDRSYKSWGMGIRVLRMATLIRAWRMVIGMSFATKMT